MEKYETGCTVYSVQRVQCTQPSAGKRFTVMQLQGKFGMGYVWNKKVFFMHILSYILFRNVEYSNIQKRIN